MQSARNEPRTVQDERRIMISSLTIGSKIMQTATELLRATG
jgi:hypothetical protein